MKRKKRLLILLALANLLARAPAPAPRADLRHQRATAQAAALARGSCDYTFETTWNPPLLKGDSR